MSAPYELLDIPRTLCPPSFKGNQFLSPKPLDQPRNPPEPKKKGYEYPQATDLKKLHERYGKLIEEALTAAHADGIKEWCRARIESTVEPEGGDIRQWQEMFKVMQSFGVDQDERIILSAG